MIIYEFSTWFTKNNEMLAPYVTEDNIDNLLKEMVGEEE